MSLKKYLPDDPSTELTVQWSNICPAQKVRSSNVKYKSLVNITLLNIAQSALCHWLITYVTQKGYNLLTFSANIHSQLVNPKHSTNSFDFVLNNCNVMIRFLHQMETPKKSKPQMGFEPTNLHDLVGCSNHWATGDLMASKGEMWFFE